MMNEILKEELKKYYLELKELEVYEVKKEKLDMSYIRTINRKILAIQDLLV